MFEDRKTIIAGVEDSASTLEYFIVCRVCS